MASVMGIPIAIPTMVTTRKKADVPARVLRLDRDKAMCYLFGYRVYLSVKIMRLDQR